MAVSGRRPGPRTEEREPGNREHPDTVPVVDEVTGQALRARGGDTAAQTAFVRATQGEVWRFVAALVDAGVADDLTQETYLRAFRALPEFAGRSSARTWLLGIARRACADHLRVLLRQRRLQARLELDPPRPVTDPARMHAVADLVARLPEDRRAAFVLTQVLGLSYEATAAIEEVPVGTIRSRVARARAALVDAVTEAAAG